MTRIDHTGHGHPSTTAARTECRKATAALYVKADAFISELSGSFGWGHKSYDEMAQIIRGTAARLGHITPAQASGEWGYEDAEAGTGWRIDTSMRVTAHDALVAIFRADPTFTMTTFARMHS